MPTIQFRYDLWYVDGGLYNIALGLKRLMDELGIQLRTQLQPGDIAGRVSARGFAVLAERGNAREVAEELRVRTPHVGDHSVVRSGDFAQGRNLAEMIGAHFHHGDFRAVR